jgi:integrase/recombinase XerD
VVDAHRLRHGAATAVLSVGTSLEEIHQSLRHRDALTTTLFVKVDIASLPRIVRPWPGSEMVA